MEQDWVVLRLPEDLLTDLKGLAAGSGVTPGQYLRDFIAEKAGAAAPAAEEIPLPQTAASNVAALREMLQDIMFTARHWTELQMALMRQGFALKPEGYGLVLFAWPSDERICKSGELGFSYSDFILRLGPGEPPEPSEIRAPIFAPYAPLQEAV